MYEEKKVIPIVLSTDDNFTVFCYVAIYSIVKYADSNKNYRIYIFTKKLMAENKKLLESLNRENICIECVEIAKFIEGVRLESSLHLSIETYYRLFIPLVLPQYEKVLYLDSDICVLDDVAKLYVSDLKGYSVGAVSDVPCDILDEHSKDIGDLDYSKTFNAGVLLMDTKKFEEEKIREKCLALLEHDYKQAIRKLIFADQDALNLTLYEKVCLLDGDWNYQPQYLWRVERIFDEKREAYVEGEHTAKIVHYAGDRKPWRYPEQPAAGVFWEIAKETKVFRRIISEMLDKCTKENLDIFKLHRFPYHLIPSDSRIVLYAAGDVGTTFYNQLQLTGHAEVVLWVDKNYEGVREGRQISNLQEISSVEYDYVLIAIDRKKTAEKVREDLLSMGVEAEKIVWDNYIKKVI